MRYAALERAVSALGVDCRPSVVYALFDAFDNDGSGVLDYQELYRRLGKGESIMSIKKEKGRK